VIKVKKRDKFSVLASLFLVVSLFVAVFYTRNPRQVGKSSAQVLPTPTLAPMTCNVKLTPSLLQLYKDQIVKFVASVNAGSSVSKVAFSVNSGIVTLNPTSVTSGPYYQTYVRANQTGNFRLTADVYLADSASPTCSTYYDMNVLPVPTRTPVTPQATKPPVTCTLTLSPDPLAINMKNSSVLSASVSVSGGSVNKVSFQSLNAGIATISPLYDLTAPYSTTIKGLKKGSTTIWAYVKLNESSLTSSCKKSVVVNVY